MGVNKDEFLQCSVCCEFLFEIGGCELDGGVL